MPTTQSDDVLVGQLAGKMEEEEDLWFMVISSFHADVNTPPMAKFNLLIV